MCKPLILISCVRIDLQIDSNLYTGPFAIRIGVKQG